MKSKITYNTAKSLGFFSLRYRFILVTSVMLLLLFSTLTFVLGSLQARTIRERIEKQGLVISKNLASVSLEHLMTYNYVALEKLVNQVVNNLDIIDVIIFDKEGKVGGYSGRPDLQNKILNDDVTKASLETKTPLITINRANPDKIKVMDIAIPVYLNESTDRWGTVRVCMSLEQMNRQLRQTRWTIFSIGFVFLVIGILLSNWAARRITSPLEKLTHATIEAAEGNLNQDFNVETRDEVEILATNFSNMINEILSQQNQLSLQLSEIKKLQQYAQSILTTMNDGLLAIDLDGKVITANPAVHTILSISDDVTLEGRRVSDVLNNNEFASYIERSLKIPTTRGQKEIALKKDNVTQVLLTSTGILKSDHKKSTQVIFSINDITAIKELEAKIRQNQRLADLGVVAAGMAHEIRNPLSAIKTFVSMLPKKIDRPDFLPRFQRTVPREINRLNGLVEDLLELSRPPKFVLNPTDMKSVLNHCAELLHADFGANDIEVNLLASDDLPKVMADEDQMKKVLINLMQNSVQAMPDGGQILLSISHTTTELTIEVKDTGSGFSSDNAGDIFTPFFTTKAKGTGLGLAITHKIITEHGGSIQAKNRKNKGCCFSITLPLSS